MIRILVIAMWVVGSLAANAQPTPYVTRQNAPAKALKYYEAGWVAVRQQNYAAAIEQFSACIDRSPNFIDAYLLRGDAHYALERFGEAEADFKRVLALDPQYEPKLPYTLGLLCYRSERFEEAVKYLEDFLKTSISSAALKEKVSKQLVTAQFAAQLAARPVPFAPQNMGEAVNSPQPEYLPALTADGNTLIFTRRVGRQEDFYVSKKRDGVWQPAYNMGAPINTPENEGAHSISADGRTLVFTVCNRPQDFGSCDLYIADFDGERWNRPRNMGQPVNGSSWEAQPSLSADGKALYFSSNREGGKGGKDLWVSRCDGAGVWSAPQPFELNTVGAEESPFIHPDNQTLYFMSNGYPSVGGMDVFVSRRRADNTWSEPLNLGYPINTVANEGSFFVELGGRMAYFASDKKGGVGTLDLYQFELYEAARPTPVTYAQVVVRDLESQQPLAAASVRIVDLASGNTFATAQTDAQGRALLCLPVGTDYAMNISAPKYLFFSENFALSAVKSVAAPYELAASLQPVRAVTSPTASTAAPRAAVVLRNIFFETGKAELLPTSKVELEQLRLLLVESPKMRIRIHGHTDNVGNDADNLRLSEQRAQAVVGYLTQKGIGSERLEWRGFGETLPLDANDTPEGRQRNRRTEFLVIE